MSVADNKGNTWTKYTEAPHWQPGGFDSTSEVWSAPQTTAGTTTITLTYTGPATSNIQWAAVIQDYTGLSTATGPSAVDVSTVAKGTSSTGNSGSTAVTTAAHELVIGGYSDDGGSDTLSAGAGYTLRVKKDGTSVSQAAIEDKDSGSTGTTQIATLNATSTADWGMSAVVFKNAVSTTADTLADRLHITGTGNVGINNSAPTNTLDVAGTARVQTTTNSTTAFQIQNASGTTLLTADATNMKVTVSALTITGNITINGHVITGGSTPTIAAGAAACTSPTVSIAGNDTSGAITVTTGTSCGTGGKLAAITFSAAFGAAPHVTLTPANSSGTSFLAYVDSGTISTTAFDLDTATTATIANNTTYKWYYSVQQ